MLAVLTIVTRVSSTAHFVQLEASRHDAVNVGGGLRTVEHQATLVLSFPV